MSELDPYVVLGVKRKATERQIRDAFRKLSKIHHPDAGGKAEQFAALVAAYQLLTDAPRRAWYDSRSWDRGPEEQIRGRAMSAISAHVQAILVADEEPRGNLVETMKKVVRGQIAKQKTEGLLNHDKVLARLDKLEGRFRNRRKGQENVIAAALTGHRAEIEKSRRGLEMGILVNEEVLRILDDYEFEEKLAAFMVQQPFWFSTSTGTV